MYIKSVKQHVKYVRLNYSIVVKVRKRVQKCATFQVFVKNAIPVFIKPQGFEPVSLFIDKNEKMA